MSAKEVRELRDKGAGCLQSFFDGPSVEIMRSETTALLANQTDGVNYNLNPGARR
jgi:hypothetical protein